MTDDRFWDGIWWVPDGEGPGLRSATLGECCAEIVRLRRSLQDVAASKPEWNGSMPYLFEFIDALREIAQQALKQAETLPKGSE